HRRALRDRGPSTRRAAEGSQHRPRPARRPPARAAPGLPRDHPAADLGPKGDLAGAIRYALEHWPQLHRQHDHGRLETDNNAAIRPLALGRENYLLAGSDDGGRHAAAIYTPIETAKLNGIDPGAWLRHVLSHLATHPGKRINEFLPLE